MRVVSNHSHFLQKGHRIRGIWGFVQRGRPQASQTLFYFSHKGQYGGNHKTAPQTLYSIETGLRPKKS